MTPISLKLITNDDELQAALLRVDVLSDSFAKNDMSVKNELDILSLIIEEYEDKNWQSTSLSPHEFLSTFLEDTGRSQKDLTKILGSQSRASDVLSGKRDLSKSQIKNLCEQWGLPPIILLGVNYQKAA